MDRVVKSFTQAYECLAAGGKLRDIGINVGMEEDEL
jgi:hypothetical protein